MKIYNIDHSEYYKNIYPKEKTYKEGFIEVADTMFQLIYHFNLCNKKVLAIGSAWGLEEFWFYIKGCILTLVDIDQPDIFTNHLDKLKTRGSMRYVIGDIFEIINELNETFDLIYTSGMHSDLMWIEEGLSNLVFDCIKTFLDKGLFIFQTYHEGLKMDDPQSVEKLKKQCEQEGLYLVSIYHFLNYSYVSLITIFKGSKKELEEYIKSIKGNIEITRFHGRSKVETKIKKVYQYE